MEMTRVEVVEPNGFMDGAIKREEGDIFSSPMGGEFVRLGWCKNVATGEVGERVEGTQKLQVHSQVSVLNKKKSV